MSDYPENPKKVVVVVGYPRSGNTYLTRLIADILDSPASRFGAALPLATEGADRPGDWFVTQLHMRPVEYPGDKRSLVDANHFNFYGYAGEHIVYIVRDPRDVAISAMHYWDLPNITETLKAMRAGTPPFGQILGSWNDFNMDWTYGFKFIADIPIINYEMLCQRTEDQLFWLMKRFVNKNIGEKKWRRKVRDAMARQDIKVKRAEIIDDDAKGIERPYGKTIQLKHLRRGIPGEWKDVMTAEENDMAWEYFGTIATLLGYSKKDGYVASTLARVE